MIIKALHKITSLSNLAQPCLKGQVATLLILLMVVVLMFILVTINIGNIADLSTMLSNAADTATLQLASKLATKSHQISEALEKACDNEEECCQKTGLLGTILAIIFAIIITILTWGSAWVVAYAAIAGAVGGAIGNAIVYGTWEAAAMGAIQGAIIGASIAAGAQMIGGMISPTQAVGDAGWGAFEAAGGLMFPTEAMTAAQLAMQTVMMSYGLPFSAFIIGGSAIYNESVNQKMKSTALKKFGEGLNGLPEYDRIREAAILTGLSMTVTDPNKEEDVYDIDGDGDRNEEVTAFENWYYKRISNIRKHLIELYKDAITHLRSDFLIPYRDYVKSLYTISDDGNVGLLVRGEIEGAGQVPPVDGRLIQVLRAMEGPYPPGYDFWNPGPNADRLALWQTCTVSNCPAQCLTVCPSGCQDCVLTGYDEIDWNIGTFRDFVAKVDALEAKSIGALTLTWEDWIKWFISYDEEGNPGGYYGRMQDMIYGNPEKDIKGYWTWIDYFYPWDDTSYGVADNPDWGVTQRLPNCIHDPANWWLVTNPPCMDRDYNFATLDADLSYDEFYGAWYDVNYLKQMQDFLIWGLQWFYSSMTNIQGQAWGDVVLNPVEYSWEDSTGAHSIKVEVGPFKVPDTEEDSRGIFLVGKECIVLDDGEDKDGDRTWVKITRTDPTKEIKSGKSALGWWNPPFHSNLGNTITRISRASFTRDYVKICGRDMNYNCRDDNDSP
jgi:hypothetical protein